MCLDSDVPTTVQSVATKRTVNDLSGLGDKLFRLGLRSWRVLRVTPSVTSMAGFELLEGIGKRQPKRVKEGAYGYVFRKLVERHKSTWSSSMAFQVTNNREPNSVILVSPDGRFMTESATRPGKVLIDHDRPARPSLDALNTMVNMPAHVARYLNLTSQVYAAD